MTTRLKFMTHEQIDLKFDVVIKANVDLLREVAPYREWFEQQ
jgi:hypothetical protein